MVDFASLVPQFGLMGLFIAAFIAATPIVLVPSELPLVIAAGLMDPWQAVLAATLGGFLSYLLSYVVGLKGVHSFLVERDAKKEKKAEEWFNKYGVYATFLASWVPVAGDFIPLVAGTLAMDLKAFVFWSFTGRLTKNVAIVFATQAFLKAIGL